MLKNFKQAYKNKRVLILGLGVLGRGLGDAIYFARAGAKVRVTDLKTKQQLQSSLAKLAKYKNVSYSLGANKLADIEWAEVIVKNPGVRLDAPVLLAAQKLKKTIVMDDSLFAQYFPGTIIGITGSKGKTTTTKLIYQVLKAAKLDVHLGGNIKGLATLPLLDKVKSNSIVVLELSSWQLQGFGRAKISPVIAVITNIYPDHQDYYGSMVKYLKDKENIFKYQKKSNTLIINSQDSYHKKFAKSAKHSNKVYYSASDFGPGFKPKLLGQHNLLNLAAAQCVGRLFKIKSSLIIKALGSFSPEPMHLELVRKFKGRCLFNDSTATIPEAVMASIKAVDAWQKLAGYSKSRIILLAGGFDKKLKFDSWVRTIKKYHCQTILFSGSGTTKLSRYLPTARIVNSMKQAVDLAWKISTPGDCILLSPGLSSFGMFKNEYDRGEQFNKQVKKLC